MLILNKNTNVSKKDIRGKVFKNGPSKICGRQSLTNLLSLQIFYRLSSTSFTWSILDYFAPYFEVFQASLSCGTHETDFRKQSREKRWGHPQPQLQADSNSVYTEKTETYANQKYKPQILSNFRFIRWIP